MDVLRLRTMARRSLFEYGKLEGLSVQDTINSSRQYTLAYNYYRYGMISFLDEILEELLITGDLRIEKPGTNVEMYEKWKTVWIESQTAKESLHQHAYYIGTRNARHKVFDQQRSMSKANLASKHRKIY